MLKQGQVFKVDQHNWIEFVLGLQKYSLCALCASENQALVDMALNICLLSI